MLSFSPGSRRCSQTSQLCLAPGSLHLQPTHTVNVPVGLRIESSVESGSCFEMEPSALEGGPSSAATSAACPLAAEAAFVLTFAWLDAVSPPAAAAAAPLELLVEDGQWDLLSCHPGGSVWGYMQPLVVMEVSPCELRGAPRNSSWTPDENQSVSEEAGRAEITADQAQGALVNKPIGPRARKGQFGWLCIDRLPVHNQCLCSTKISR